MIVAPSLIQLSD